jgi:hypothetical protein
MTANFALHWTGSSRFSLFQWDRRWRLLPASELSVNPPVEPSPKIIDGASVLCWAETAGVAKTNACTFRADGHVQSEFAGLAIAQYTPDSGCYLFLCDENWETQNDSLHRELLAAKSFAEAMYPGISARWRPPAE